MTELVPGHQYQLNTLDGSILVGIVYVQRQGEKYPSNTLTHPGTTVQEVCRAQIARLKYVNMQTPCTETVAAIELERKVIYTLEFRAARIHNRVLKADSHEIELQPTCSVCGHIDHQCKETK